LTTHWLFLDPVNPMFVWWWWQLHNILVI